MWRKNLAEKMQVGFTDGGVLVGRTLVHSLVPDPGAFARFSEFARYARLLAAKLRLPLLDQQKIVLSAWLAALEEHPDIVRPLVQQYHLENILPQTDASPDPNNPSIGWQILSLVAGYQELCSHRPGVERNLDAVRAVLKELWAVNPLRQTLLNKFLLILRDEQFLFSLEATLAQLLIVDPQEVINSVLSVPLRNRGYQVEVVGNAHDAYDALAEYKPTLLVVEMNMPVEDGLTVCRKVKSDPRTSDIPIVMLTSSKSQRKARLCLKAGADDVVIKPVDIELFFIKVRKMVEARLAAMPAGARVTGSLEEISLTDLIQILSAGLKSTKLSLRREDGAEGVIFMRDGEVIEAEAEGVFQAEPAFYRLVTWKKGTFAMQSCTEFPPRSIQIQTMSLLMEAVRRSDEGIAADAPPTMEMESPSDPEPSA